MSAYKRDFGETKYLLLKWRFYLHEYMFVLIKDDGLLEKYNETWEKS